MVVVLVAAEIRQGFANRVLERRWEKLGETTAKGERVLPPCASPLYIGVREGGNPRLSSKEGAAA